MKVGWLSVMKMWQTLSLCHVADDNCSETYQYYWRLFWKYQVKLFAFCSQNRRPNWRQNSATTWQGMVELTADRSVTMYHAIHCYNILIPFITNTEIITHSLDMSLKILCKIKPTDSLILHTAFITTENMIVQYTQWL